MSLKTWGDDGGGIELPIVTDDDGSASRQLIWEMSPTTPSGSDSVTRLYRHPDGLEITINAQWSGTAWEKDVSGTASRLRIEAEGTVQHFHNGGATSFSDASWTGDFSVSPDLDEQASINANAELEGPGATEAFFGIQCPKASYSGNTNVGTACTYRKRFPATPSSITRTFLASYGVKPGTPYNSRAYGTGIYFATNSTSESPPIYGGQTVWAYGTILAS